MVSKKVNAKILMNIFFVVVLISVLAVFVFAATGLVFSGTALNVSTFLVGGNYTGDSIFMNITTTLNQTAGSTHLAFNLTCFYNSSGGDVFYNYTSSGDIDGVGNLTPVIWNGSNSDNSSNFTFYLDISRLADSYTYNISCIVSNGSVQNVTSIKNITIDRTPPAVNFPSLTSYLMSTGEVLVHDGNYTTADLVKPIYINVSTYDAIDCPKYGNTSTWKKVWLNVTNSLGDQVNFTILTNMSHINKSLLHTFYNITNGINFTNATVYPDGRYNLTIFANDSMNSTGVATPLNNLNNSEYMQITIDRVAPTSVVLTAGIGGTINKNVIVITAADATTGIESCELTLGSGTLVGKGSVRNLNHTGLNCGTSYSYTVICTDFVGLSATSLSTSFSTSSCGGSGPSGPGTIVSTTVDTTIVDISPEAEATLSGFEEDMGIKEIKIAVTEVAGNVQVVVRKFDTEPAEITVSKTGQVHKYLQITTQNLGTKLDKAVITIKVQKNWLLDNSIDKANIAMFKLDEVAGEWDELVTVYKEEDATYYYYDVEVDSFSYFAIGEKVIGEGEEEEGEGEEVERNLLWLWIVIGVVVLAVIIGGGIAVKKKK